MYSKLYDIWHQIRCNFITKHLVQKNKCIDYTCIDSTSILHTYQHVDTDKPYGCHQHVPLTGQLYMEGISYCHCVLTAVALPPNSHAQRVLWKKLYDWSASSAQRKQNTHTYYSIVWCYSKQQGTTWVKSSKLTFCYFLNCCSFSSISSKKNWN